MKIDCNDFVLKDNYWNDIYPNFEIVGYNQCCVIVSGIKQNRSLHSCILLPKNPIEVQYIEHYYTCLEDKGKDYRHLVLGKVYTIKYIEQKKYNYDVYLENMDGVYKSTSFEKLLPLKKRVEILEQRFFALQESIRENNRPNLDFNLTKIIRSEIENYERSKQPYYSIKHITSDGGGDIPRNDQVEVD